MITMTEFKQIVQLRNEGKTQQEIAELLGISRRSVIRYLKNGSIPVYSREKKATRPDPMEDFYGLVEEKLSASPSILLQDLYQYLCERGYQGSERSLRRKTLDLRKRLKSKEVFFQRKSIPGEVMEGDFTELYLDLGGQKKKIYLWVTSLPFSNTFFVTPYFHCSFECFADGSVNAFNEFGGIAKKYRLDNMSPVVSKVLCGKDRLVTQRYKAFQDHYGFQQDFCNPGRGNEKGHVESNIKHIKKRLLSQIALHNLTFSSLEALKDYLKDFSRSHNAAASTRSRFSEESLLSLPEAPFSPFRTTVVKINRYSLFSLDKNRHMYSVPSQLIGLSLEVRIYPDRVDVIDQCKVVASHKRIYGPPGLVSIQIEHIIDGLLKKPGAIKDWKYKNVLFERPSWQRFYTYLMQNNGSDKDYLSCLRLINQHGRSLVTIAMELAMESDMSPCSTELENLISNRMDNIYDIQPIETNLAHYDELMGGKVHGC